VTATTQTPGRDFWHLSFEDLWHAMADRRSEYDNPNEPGKFKLYRGLPRKPLPANVPRVLDGTAEFDDMALSTLLHYAYGISRQEFETSGTWPYHRMVASARCLFSVQLYVCLPDGVYHFDPAHHTLVRLRAGDHRPLLAAATGSDFDGASAVVVLAALFWKAAFIYRDYAYRLCTEETGLVAGNLQAVGTAMGMETHVHHQFLDEPVNKLLGLEPDEESALAVLALYPRPREIRRSAEARSAADLAYTLADISPPVVATTSLTGTLCPRLTAVNRASFLNDTNEIGSAAAPVPAVTNRPLPMPARSLPSIELASVLRQRDSGPSRFIPVPSRVDGVALWVRLAAISAEGVSDTVPANSPLEIFLTVADADGITPGTYRLDQATSALYPVGDGSGVAGIEGVTVPGPVFDHITAVVHLVGDRDWALQAFGDRSYRILNQEAGMLAQRVCVAAAALGLSARITNAYDVEGIRATLGLAGSARTPMFQILLARTGPGPRLVVPVEPEGAGR
jgi:SagB-type dehydrogenase family enzyme